MIAAVAMLFAISKIDVAPLQAALQQYDREIAALQATLQTPGTADASAQTQRAVAAIDASAAHASARARDFAQSQSRQLAIREDNAANAALAPHGADRALAQFRDDLEAQDAATTSAFAAAMDLRERRALAEREQQLYENESTLAFDLARADGGRRLALRLKLDDLRLDRNARARLQAQLEALDRGESARVAAMHERDAGILAAYRAQLESRRASEVASMQSQMQTRFAASLGVRTRVARALARTASRKPYDLAAAAFAMQVAFAQTAAALKRDFSGLERTDRDSAAATRAEIASLRAARARLASAILAAQLRR
ncbi:MAG: hypothetical protein JO199_10825 [Candidatus Eremiobacteraeota bacterium]|nr:hypothetical protein [Candidatus Eremiobacteraeota bacterium]